MLNKQNKILLLYKFFLFCFNILLSFIFGRSYLVEMSIAKKFMNICLPNNCERRTKGGLNLSLNSVRQN